MSHFTTNEDALVTAFKSCGFRNQNQQQVQQQNGDMLEEGIFDQVKAGLSAGKKAFNSGVGAAKQGFANQRQADQEAKAEQMKQQAIQGVLALTQKYQAEDIKRFEGFATAIVKTAQGNPELAKALSNIDWNAVVAGYEDAVVTYLEQSVGSVVAPFLENEQPQQEQQPQQGQQGQPQQAPQQQPQQQGQPQQQEMNF